MEIYHIFLHSHRQVKVLDNQHKRLFDFHRLIYNCLYVGETQMCSALFFLNYSFIPLGFSGKIFNEAD